MALGAVAASVALGACGSGARQDANEPSGNFTVTVPVAKFPASQRLAQHTHLVISCATPAAKTIPNVAVTITNPAIRNRRPGVRRADLLDDPATGEPVAADLDHRPAAGTMRLQLPVRAARAAPSPPTPTPGRSARCDPGATATFVWAVTAVKPGTHLVQYRVAAGLNGKAKAVLAGGEPPVGTFKVNVTSVPQQSFVNNNGQVVKTG